MDMFEERKRTRSIAAAGAVFSRSRSGLPEGVDRLVDRWS